MSRLLFMATALSVFLAVAFGLHAYVFQRLVVEAAPGDELVQLAGGLIAGLGLLLVLAPVVSRSIPPRRIRPLVWPAYFWMGALWLLVVGTAASDLVLWGVFRGDATPDAARIRSLIVWGLGLGAASAAALSMAHGPAVRRVEVALERWPAALDGFRIVQLSDIHVGPTIGRRFLSKVVKRARSLEPDAIVLTGDLVDGRVAHLAADVEPLAELEAPHGVYFVTGNHDHYSGANAWAAHIASLGLRVLRNDRVTIEHGGAAFDLAGVDDYRGVPGDDGGEDLEAALQGRDPSRPVVLLAHDPASFDGAARAGVDLQLSGHTHGGQIWPFGFLVRLVTPYVAGLFHRGESRLYVSRGTGYWGPPMRLLAPAEVTELVIRRAG